MRIAIIADDLTGAADSAAPFAAQGWSASVRWTAKDAGVGAGVSLAVRDPISTSGLKSKMVTSWNAATRDLPGTAESAIRNAIRAALNCLEAASCDLVYKKIDSTLRGRLRLELDAIRDALPGRMAVVCPAFPANGRTVRDGALWLRGEQRENVRAAFGMAGDSKAAELDLPAIRSGRKLLSARLRELQTCGFHTIFCDAETDLDLATIATALLEMPQLALPAGSAGLAAAIASAIGPQSPQSPRSPLSRHSAELSQALQELAQRPVLVVVGSRHAASRRQAERLAKWAGISPIELRAADREMPDAFGPDEQDLLDFSFQPDGGGMNGSVREIEDRFAAGERIALVVTPDEDHAGPDGEPHSLPLRLSAIGAAFGLVVTGGHTAQQVIAASPGWNGIEVLGEREPGIVTGRILADGPSATLHGRPIILKSGGFGDTDTLVRCLRQD